MFFGVEFIFVLMLFAIGLALTVFWLWMLFSAIVNQGLGDGEKVAWVIAIIFTHFIGALVYCIIGWPKRI